MNLAEVLVSPLGMSNSGFSISNQVGLHPAHVFLIVNLHLDTGKKGKAGFTAVMKTSFRLHVSLYPTKPIVTLVLGTELHILLTHHRKKTVKQRDK